MENDLIETITFYTDTTAEPTCMGELRFTYLEELPAAGEPLFGASRDVQRGAAGRSQDGMLWLTRLAAGQVHP